MECICGCGRKLRRGQHELSIEAGAMAVELLAWDKARAAGHLGPPAADDAERVIGRGADCYQRLLGALHGEREGFSLEEAEDWVRESKAEREDRQYMTAKGGLLKPSKLLLTEEDFERLDRAHPERSFSARVSEGPGEEVVGRLERLSALHAEGALADEEFAAAKARVLGAG